MKFPDWLKVWGDVDYRNKRCPLETDEQISFFHALSVQFPHYFDVALHPKNEGKRTWGQIYYDKKAGLKKGASDVIIPGYRSFVCEIKRRDHTLCTWQDGQREYLEAALSTGCYACCALGWEAAIDAVTFWDQQVAVAWKTVPTIKPT